MISWANVYDSVITDDDPPIRLRLGIRSIDDEICANNMIVHSLAIHGTLENSGTCDIS